MSTTEAKLEDESGVQISRLHLWALSSVSAFGAVMPFALLAGVASRWEERSGIGRYWWVSLGLFLMAVLMSPLVAAVGRAAGRQAPLPVRSYILFSLVGLVVALVAMVLLGLP